MSSWPSASRRCRASPTILGYRGSDRRVEALKDRVLQFMSEKAYKPLTLGELARSLGLRGAGRKELRRLLERMEREGLVVKTRAKRYGIPSRMNLVVGHLEANARGFGFVIPDDDDFDDVFIGPDGMGGAMHRDRVIARINRKAFRDARAEGEIIRVLERAHRRVVGSFDKYRNYGFVVPADRRLFQDIFVPPGEDAGAADGEVVVVEITSWPAGRRGAQGRVVERIGKGGDPGVDIEIIIRKHGLPLEFPEEVMAWCQRVPGEVGPEDLEGRLDLRDTPTITIDPEEAKDLDDAVSLERLGDRWRLGVHIADVSHYVPEGSALDKEARERGTSVYLVDRVIPMLPPRLSNGICSLNPGVDRLALSVFMEFDDRGRRLNYSFRESVIRSDHRMTYAQVAKLLEEPEGELARRYSDVVPMIRAMRQLMLLLRERRWQRGSIDFDLPEAKVILDERGRPVDVFPYPRTDANQIIEEFMIACNETVAEHFHHLGVPFLYRVHERPDEEKMEELAAFVAHFGYTLKGARKLHPKILQELLGKVEGRPEENIIRTVMLRSMKQARYCAENLGHFGLASEHYAHFTSPIRRYPDLVIHRVVKEVLREGALPQRRLETLEARLPEWAVHCSKRERVAVEAERESLDLKKAEFMADKLGEVYDGIISGVTSFGFFVALPNTVEGIVHVSNIVDDYYHYDEKLHALVGERTRRRFSIGDHVRVQVWKVDLASRSVEFGLLD